MVDPANPYAPPTADEVFDTRTAEFVYQPSEGLSTALRILLGLCAALLIVDVWSMTLQADLLERAMAGATISTSEANANDERVTLLDSAYLLLYLVAGIVWCVWQNRTSKNARALGASMMQYGPNAWGWFFCPVVNLWRPVQVISELWTATLPDAAPGDHATSGWRGIAVPNWVVGGWWLPWLGGNIVSYIATRMLLKFDDISSLIAGSRMQIVASLLTAVSGAFAIVLVTMLQKRVQARADQRRR